MKVIQILPELNGGGVERGTLELGDHLVKLGHDSLVVSNGGRMVAALEQGGSRHLCMPVHLKHPRSLALILRLRRLFLEEKPDIIHLRSRMPAWLAWLAWLSLDRMVRPRLVTTVHGFYSVNAYSAVMTKGEAVIAVSESIRDQVLADYPQTRPEKLRVIHRGVDETLFHPGYNPEPGWLATWESDFPQLAGKIVLLMPGRLTRWKGQEDFLRLLRMLLDSGYSVHGLIVGEPHPKKLGFLDELKSLAGSLGITDRVSFLGHRTDLKDIMSISTLVCSLSRDPEAFGRVSLEAMALGKPVLGYGHGGVAEQLKAMFPAGLVPPGDLDVAFERALDLLNTKAVPGPLQEFRLSRMLDSTVEVYAQLLSRPEKH